MTHTYTKPGSYTVKLTVRNFLGDENERSVPVDVATAAEGPRRAAHRRVRGAAGFAGGLNGAGDLTASVADVPTPSTASGITATAGSRSPTAARSIAW